MIRNSLVIGISILVGTTIYVPDCYGAARDTVNIGVSIEPPGLDPTRSPSEAIGTITYHNIFEGLTGFDRQGSVQPLLARSWTVSEDGLTYKFDLRDKVFFHDGAKFDCAAVKFSLLRAGATDSTNPNRDAFANIADIRCPDDLTAEVVLKRPHGSFTYELAWNDASIMSPQSVVDNPVHPVGTGPYVFKEWARGDHVTLVKNTHYWGRNPQISTATFHFIADPLAAGNALISGALDAYPSFPDHDMLGRFKKVPHLEIVQGSFPFKAILALNNARSPFKDWRVRQAIAYAIDRKSILLAQADGEGTLIQSHMAPNDPDYVPIADPYPYDPVRARQLLAQAGVRPGIVLTLSYPPIGYARDTSELVAAYLEDVGITVVLRPLAWPAWLGQVFGRGAFDMTVIAHTEPHDIGIYDRDNIYFHYHSPKFHELYASYEASQNPSERHGLSEAMQRLLAADEPNVFLYSVARDTVMNKDLQGMWTDQQVAACPIADLSWKQ